VDTPAQRSTAPEWFRAPVPPGIPGTVSTLSPAFLGQLVAPWRDCDPQCANVLRIKTQKNIGGLPPGAFFGPQNSYVQGGGALIPPTPTPNFRANSTAQILVYISQGGQAPAQWRWLTIGADMELSGVVMGRNLSFYIVRWDGVPLEMEFQASLTPLAVGGAGGYPFEWRVETVFNLGPGPGGAQDVVPPPAATQVEISATSNTVDVEWIDRDTVTTIGGFQWALQSSRRYFVPQRAGAGRFSASQATNVTAQWIQGAA
jgi:hypothetical protein